MSRAAPRAFGSWLLGRPGEPGRDVTLRVRLLLIGTILAANVVGAMVVIGLVLWLLADEVLQGGALLVVNFVAVPVYVLFALAAGLWWGLRRVAPKLSWVADERSPAPAEARAALRAPLSLLAVQAVLWAVATVAFSLLAGRLDAVVTVKVALVVALGGAVTCAHAYLLSEFALRPVAARALVAGVPERVRIPGATARALLAWALGSGVPVLGLVVIAVFALIERDVSPTRLAVTMIIFGALVLAAGFPLMALAVRATVDPIRGLRAALGGVAAGDLDARVEVYDGTEIGQLQSGFNRMVAGLRERERIRDLFGRHVGEDVARTALERGIELGGEVRDVAVLFVDIVGSTRLAATRPPDEVVTLLNRFFGVVVDAVVAHGGLINKFEGDAALVVFGAPEERDDACADALAAARELATRLAAEVPEVAAGIGVAAGPAVAGNIGAEQRFEYTVIGDPVNEAARLTEFAKELPGRVLASMPAVDGAAAAERERWRPAGDIVLRGRTAPTAYAVPRD